MEVSRNTVLADFRSSASLGFVSAPDAGLLHLLEETKATATAEASPINLIP